MIYHLITITCYHVVDVELEVLRRFRRLKCDAMVIAIAYNYAISIYSNVGQCGLTHVLQVVHHENTLNMIYIPVL